MKTPAYKIWVAYVAWITNMEWYPFWTDLNVNVIAVNNMLMILEVRVSIGNIEFIVIITMRKI